jgi:hypothetical protein
VVLAERPDETPHERCSHVIGRVGSSRENEVAGREVAADARVLEAEIAQLARGCGIKNRNPIVQNYLNVR